jgi:hypothetical protein
MKKVVLVILISCSYFFSCSKHQDENISQSSITLNFSHHWDGTLVTNSDFNAVKFINAFGNQLSIEGLRYLISKVTFYKTNGSKRELQGYNLIDVTNNQTLVFSPQTLIDQGTYSNVTFTFGFNNEDNAGNYTDLNSALWNVPAALGGDYHYMQLDGKFLNTLNQEQGFNYHVIRAVENPGDHPTFPQDTFFNVDLGPVTIYNNTTFNIEMNIADWFKNPNTWDLNILNQMLMPNANAQIMMYENGLNVFSLKSITQ